ncbi:MAG: ECF transporter S component [Clostridia bacterium]|nr:ECF transporter S component [Clostridia bacterium]
MTTRKNHSSIVKMTYFAISLALMLVLHFAIGSIPVGTTKISVVLIPISIGAMLLGPAAGAALGLIYGAIVLIQFGVMALDPFTAILFQNEPFMTSVICLVKTTLAGFLSGLAYKLLKEKNQIVATFVAAAITPIVNTGVFILLCLTIPDVLLANFVEAGSTVIMFLIVGVAGWNFIWEFVVNMIFAPAMNTVAVVVSKRLNK